MVTIETAHEGGPAAQSRSGERQGPVRLEEDAVLEPESPPGSKRNGAQEQIAAMLKIIVVAVGLAFCYFASSLCITVVLSALIAVLIDPVVAVLEKARLGRTLASGVVILCIVIVFGFLAYEFYQKADSFADKLPAYSTRVEHALRPLIDRVDRLKAGAESLK